MEKLAIYGGSPVRTAGFPEWPISGQLEEQLLLEVLHSKAWGGNGGEMIPRFVEEFIDFQEAKYGIACVNGTMALTIALQAAGVQPGDEVIIPPYTFIASATAALLFGAIPVFVDVEPDTQLLDPEKIEAAITPKTRAIMPVHMSGAPANLSRIKEIAQKHGLRIIEDAAQAHGAEWEGQGVGSIGDIGTFSFQNSKNMSGGEGGIIVTNDKELAERAWSITNVGRTPKGAWYQHDRIGWNLRMTEWQAAVLLGQLSRVKEQMQLREKNAALLTQLLQNIEGIQVLKRDTRITKHAYHLFGMRLMPELTTKLESKKQFLDQVNAEGIPLGAGFPQPLHRNQAILDSIKQWTGEDRAFDCPVAERMCHIEAVRFYMDVLMADEKAIYDIASALKKVTQTYL